MSEDVKLGIGAQLEASFQEALEHAKEQSAEASESIKEHFEGINKTFEKVQAAFLAFTAVLAGGEAFKEMIGSTVDAVKESGALGRQLGISATSASQLKVAMASVFVTQDQVTGASQKITMALKKNESAFTDLGVATRDSNGHFRNALEIQMDVNAELMKFTAGTDRNVEGVKIYGKGWLEAQNTLRLTSKVFEEAKEESDALGLTVGTENVAAVARYRSAMNSAHEVMEGIGKVIATALMPVLSSMGEWFAEHGPQAVNIFRATIFSLEAVWIGVKGAVTLFVDYLIGSLDLCVTTMVAAGKVMVAAITPGQSVGVAWDKALSDIAKKAKFVAGVMVTDAKNTATEIADAMASQSGDTTKIDDPKKGEDSSGGDEKKAKLLAELAAELEAQKASWATEHAARGEFVAFTLEQERAFWESKKGLAVAGSLNALEIQKNINKLTVDIDKAAYTDQIAALKAQESAYKNNLQAKLAIAQEMQAKIAAAEGDKGAAARAAGGEVLAIEREIKAQQLAIDTGYEKASEELALSKIDAAKRDADLQEKLGVTSESELLAQDRGFEEQRYQVKLDALNKKLTLLQEDPDTDLVKVQEINDQKVALETQYQAQMDQLRIKSVQMSNKDWQSMFSVMQSGFTSTIGNFLKGTTSLASTIRGMYNDIAKSVIDTLAKILAQQLINHIKSIAMAKLERMESQQANAVKAGSAAWASAADIPVVGWILGPLAGAAAYAGVMAMAEGGYDIPAGVNPIVQAHASEMILPSKHADVIRSLADGGGNQGGGNHFSPSINVSAMDGPSFVKWMNQNAGPVSASLKNLHGRFMGS